MLNVHVEICNCKGGQQMYSGRWFYIDWLYSPSLSLLITTKTNRIRLNLNSSIVLTSTPLFGFYERIMSPILLVTLNCGCGMVLVTGDIREMQGLARTLKGRLMRWAAGSVSDNKCTPVYYTGCEGNLNNYRTEQECQTSCPEEKGVVIVVLCVPLDPQIMFLIIYHWSVKSACELPADLGPCQNYTARPSVLQHGVSSTYNGGCDENGNTLFPMSVVLILYFFTFSRSLR